MSALAKHDDLDMDTIAAALRCIDANMARDKWARIGMALKSELGEAGFGLFDEWSKSGDGYDAVACRDTWKSIRPGGGVNIGTLIYQAQQNGFSLRDDRPTLSPEQIERRRREREEEQARAAAERKQMQGEAARIANLTWDAARPAGPMHPYLARKQVAAHGLMLGDWPLFKKDSMEIWRHIPGALLIPILDAKNGKLISLQGIYQDDQGEVQKRYLKNGRKRGGFHMIGTPPAAGGVVAFCEGYATGATIHDLTGWCVIVTFDAPNLPVVAEAMRAQFPQAAFIICADNDAFTTRQDGTPYNPGVDYGQTAAKATNGFLIVPRFADASNQPTDFNDLAALEGKAIACAQLLDNPVSGRPDTSLVNAPKLPANDNVDYFTPLPDVGGRGKPLATIENLAEVVARLRITVRYNVIAKNQEIIIPGEGYLVDNRDNDTFARLESECAKFGMPIGNLNGFVGHIAGQNPFNPVASWITSKPWDGTPRLQQLLDTVVPVEDKKLPDGRSLKDMLIRRWMVSAVIAAFAPDGVSAHGILVFQGPQYLGKTMWFKQLVPEHLALLQDGMMLNPGDRDSVKQVVSFWLVELGELDATFRKADLAQLKSFVTRKQDVLRLPYARKESTFARRTVFFGSVNPREFLHDITGNRRYWTIECKAIDLEGQRQLDMQQVWAEVLHIHQQGESHYLTTDEMAALNDHNPDFQAVDPIEERIQTRLDWEAPASMWAWRTSTEILLLAGVDRPSSGDATKGAHIMRKLNGGQARRYGGKNQLLCPPVLGSARGANSPDEDRPF